MLVTNPFCSELKRNFSPVLTLLVVCDEGLGQRLPDGVDLRGVSATLDADTDVHVAEALLPEEEEGFLQLVLQGLGLHQVQGATVHLDEALAALAVGNGGGGFLKEEEVET